MLSVPMIDQAHMKRHLYSHTGIKPHVCRWKCGAIFASYGGRMKHERINHYDENPLQSECDICARPFKNTQQVRVTVGHVKNIVK